MHWVISCLFMAISSLGLETNPLHFYATHFSSPTQESLEREAKRERIYCLLLRFSSLSCEMCYLPVPHLLGWCTRPVNLFQRQQQSPVTAWVDFLTSHRTGHSFSIRSQSHHFSSLCSKLHILVYFLRHFASGRYLYYHHYLPKCVEMHEVSI